MSKVCLLIHGYLTDYHDFTCLPSYLIKYYDQVILLSLPGHEHKDNLKNFTSENVFNYVEKEVEAVISNNIVDIIGFSLGGALAWYLSLKYDLNKVVLLAPALDNINFGLPLDIIINRFNLNKLSEDEKRISLRKAKIRRTNALKFVLKNTFPKFNLVNGLEFLKIIHKINKNDQTSSKPTLIIRGELDELIKRSVIKKINNQLRGPKEVYEVPNIGHMMLRSDYEKNIINRILCFLGSD